MLGVCARAHVYVLNANTSLSGQDIKLPLVFIYRPVSKSIFTSSKHIPLHMLAKGEKKTGE